MIERDLIDTLDAAATRRRVLKTGAKLAYAAPLVAASMRLTAGGAGAVSGGGSTCIEVGQRDANGQLLQCQNQTDCCSLLCRANELFGLICVCRDVNFACEVDENCCGTLTCQPPNTSGVRLCG